MRHTWFGDQDLESNLILQRNGLISAEVLAFDSIKIVEAAVFPRSCRVSAFSPRQLARHLCGPSFPRRDDFKTIVPVQPLIEPKAFCWSVGHLF